MADIASALVLTAGLGTRLRPLTLVGAKPAVPVAGEPLIRRIVRWLVAFAVGATIVLVAIEAAGGREWLRSIVGSGSLSLDALDAVVGATIALVMAALAVAARAIASKS